MGASNLPDGVKTTFKISQKVTDQLQCLKSTDSGATWATETVTFDSIANTVTFGTAPAATDLMMISNSVGNQSAIQSDPQAVLQVQPKTIASNSHSVNLGAMMVYAATGRVPTGNS